jgi:hypothetical protein
LENNETNADAPLEQSSDDNLCDQPPQPVCPNCLTPCSPLDYYCPHCGSNEALNPLASYMPFVRLRFTTGLAGRLWDRSRKAGTILWAIFYLLILMLLLLFFSF